ncbi:unnamed protein product [Prunus armeniaca]|uniref:Thioredoxin domain-containing protein n=1 Tax=Prunus armeniaca TaxID=36596 RepID=A0A6J5XVI4_PRUAR|nr:unnamed protein product [Prunus armeniaca]
MEFDPLEVMAFMVDGNFLERALASKQRTGYTVVLFYASWCPFSCSMYPTFGMLSFMFPQVEHLAIEQSSALPRVLACLKAFWVLYVPHFNLGIFGETSQIMGRILHMVDVRRIWNKLRLCKTQNFHKGAKNARVWASSLTSVSLGESSARSSSSSSS